MRRGGGGAHSAPVSDRRRDAGGAGPRGSLARRAGLTGAGTLVSRVLGLVRDVVVARTFSLAATDAFFVAFTIPNALRGLLAEGATSAAVVPLTAEARARGGEAEARRFFGGFVVAMGAVLVAVATAGAVGAPALVEAYAGGYADDPSRFALTVRLTRLVMPYVALIGLASVLTGVLQASGRFAAAGLAPMMLNVGLVGAALALAGPAERLGVEPISVLAVGALAGGAGHVAWLAIAVRRAGLGARLRNGFRDPRVRRAFRLLGPLVVGVGVYQLNVLLGRRFASFLEVGAQSYLYYAQRLVEVPQGMVALAVAAAALQALAAEVQAGDEAAARRTLEAALGLVLFLAVPAAALLGALAEPLAAVLFGGGAFGPEDARATAAALVAMAAGVVPVSLVRAAIPAFHARQEPRAPVWAGAANLATFGASAPLLMGRLGHVGIAAAIALAAHVQLVALFLLLRRRGIAPRLRPLGASLARAGVAAAAAALAARGVAAAGRWDLGARAPGNVAWLALALGVAGVVFLAAGAAVRAPELTVLRDRLARRRG